MADVVYLHIGAPKTGTTYLQERLYANRVSLAEQGIHYPVGPEPDMFGAALDLIDRQWGGLREVVRGEWDALVGRVAAVRGTAVVSHEILAGATPEQIERAKRDLAGVELHLVYSARDIARQIPAEWQESVKHRNVRSFKAYLRRLERAQQSSDPVWFWRVQGLPDVLNRWSGGLPPEHVHLVTVPPKGAAPDELWLRYCTAFGIDPAHAPIEAERSNPSLGIEETALVRELNRRLKAAGLDSAHYRQLVRKVVVHDTLAHRSGMRKVELPPRSREWAEGIADTWIDWVQGAGINVVGDVEELRPVFRDDEVWADPDKPRKRLMADAALEALVAVILEAAERPEPKDPPLTRLSRAARKLAGT
jgi:hypothetical protein